MNNRTIDQNRRRILTAAPAPLAGAIGRIGIPFISGAPRVLLRPFLVPARARALVPIAVTGKYAGLTFVVARVRPVHAVPHLLISFIAFALGAGFVRLANALEADGGEPFVPGADASFHEIQGARALITSPGRSGISGESNHVINAYPAADGRFGLGARAVSRHRFEDLNEVEAGFLPSQAGPLVPLSARQPIDPDAQRIWRGATAGLKEIGMDPTARPEYQRVWADLIRGSRHLMVAGPSDHANERGVVLSSRIGG